MNELKPQELPLFRQWSNDMDNYNVTNFDRIGRLKALVRQLINTEEPTIEKKDKASYPVVSFMDNLNVVRQNICIVGDELDDIIRNLERVV